jgi:aminodeoxyfutalosine synthase
MNFQNDIMTQSPSALVSIREKVLNSDRISEEDAMYLFDKAELAEVAQLAQIVNERKSGRRVYFNRNFHIEPTNVCVYSCKFCSYSRLMKHRSEGWELTMDEIMDKVKAYDNLPVTEVHIVGGVMPQYGLEFYTDLYRRIKEHRPDLHIKALTPVEYHYIFKKGKVSYADGMKLMREAGLDSIPGGGAEIFHPEIREVICKDKCNAEEWLELHRVWHKLGMRSNATILYGHIENTFHRVDHMRRLRELQDETGGFQTFIPLKFLNENNEMSHVPMTSVVDDMKMYAVARVFLDNFDHLKAYWPMLGRQMAQLSLAFGVDDLDGTIDDSTRIYSMAGSEEQNPAMNTQDLAKMILDVRKIPVERDTLYNVVKEYHQEDLELADIRGYN